LLAISRQTPEKNKDVSDYHDQEMLCAIILQSTKKTQLSSVAVSMLANKEAGGAMDSASLINPRLGQHRRHCACRRSSRAREQ
jgi:hypothetical protein